MSPRDAPEKNLVEELKSLRQQVAALKASEAERQRAEDALRESEERLAITLRSIGEAVITTDVRGFVTLMNPVAEALTGWNQEDAAGRPLEDVFNIVNEQTGQKAEAPVGRVIREGVVVGLANHTALIAKDGAARPIQDSGAPIKDAEGNVFGVILVFRDITERKQSEEALRLRSQEMEALYKVAAILVQPGSFEEKASHVMEAVAQVVQADHAILWLLDRERQWLRQVSIAGALIEWARRLPQISLDHGVSGLAATTQQPVIANDYVHHPRATPESIQDGQKAVAAFPLHAGKEVLGVLAAGSSEVGHFTPERVQLLAAICNQLGVLLEDAHTQEALRESEERYRTLVDSVTDIIHTKDAEGRYVTVNTELIRRLGVPREAFIGKTALDLYPPELGREILEEDLRVVKTGTMREVEREIPTTEGPIISFIRKVPLRDEAGAVVGLVTVSRDITERKRLEEVERRHTQELQTLFNIAGLLVQPGSFEEKVNRVLQALVQVAQASSATFRLLDRERQTLRHISAVGRPSAWVKKTLELPLDRGISGMAARTQQPVIANDYANHPSAVPQSIEEGVEAMAALPMHGATGVLGVVTVAARQAGHFTPQRVQLLTAIVNQLGALFENARAQGVLRDMALFTALNPAPVLSFDDRGIVLSSNSAALSLLGEEARESAPLASLLPSMAGIDLERCIREGLVLSHEVGVGERHFQIVIKGAPDLGIGHVYGSDITERKRAEDVLQQKVQELTALNKMFQSHIDARLKIESAYYRLSTAMVRLSEDIQDLAKEAEAWKGQVEQVLVKERGRRLS